jgi:hypothetical protein
MKDGSFDITKIPEICDMLKYDLYHNYHIIGEIGHQLYDMIKFLSEAVMPLEFGVDRKQKIEIGLKIVSGLLKKVHHDLLWWKKPNQN